MPDVAAGTLVEAVFIGGPFDGESYERVAKGDLPNRTTVTSSGTEHHYDASAHAWGADSADEGSSTDGRRKLTLYYVHDDPFQIRGWANEDTDMHLL